MKILLLIIVLIHGAIHTMGFLKGFGIAEINELKTYISKPVGLFWLITTVLFLTTFLLIMLGKEWWWMVAVPAVIASQILIILSWQDAKYGTIFNVIIFIASFLAYGTWSFNTIVRNEIPAFLPVEKTGKQIIKEEMLSDLPFPVQRWLRRSGIIGKELISNVYLNQKGEMRTKPDGSWMPFSAEQYFTLYKPGFLWLADVEAAPFITIAGKDKYEDGKGHMLIKLLSLIPVADAKGETIDQGSMLRYLGESTWFPSFALSKYIKWEEIDSLNAKVFMSYGNISASALFHFTEEGDILSFEAERYYQREETSTLEKWLVTVDGNSFKEFQGIRVPFKYNITWKLETGDFHWLKLEVTDIKYY
jgi:hypothetical protein